MSFTNLKGFSSVQDATLNNEIQDGLVEFFDWALLEKGNYFNVSREELAPDGTDYSRLRVSTNDNYPSGKAWDGFHSNWVWQSGISYSPAPKVGTNNTYPGLSGVYVDNVYYPTATTTGTYGHYIDYYNGRVVFNSVLPTGSKVQVEYSYKWIGVEYPDSVPWLKEAMNALQPGDNFLNNADNGQWNIPPEGRVQLPVIAIELVPVRKFRGYQLGGGQLVYTDVLFHCLAADKDTRDKLMDIVSLQNDKTIHVFDSNRIDSSGAYPIDFRGTPVSGALRYPDLVDRFYGGNLRLTNGTSTAMKAIKSNIYGGIVRFTTEGIKSDI